MKGTVKGAVNEHEHEHENENDSFVVSLALVSVSSKLNRAHARHGPRFCVYCCSRGARVGLIGSSL